MTWSIRAFADLAGVTVKALHHYERRGLLAPRRSRAGYRRYTLRDLARLERIVALKALGLSLADIRGMEAQLKGSRGPDALRAHRDQLAEKQRRLGEMIAALDAVARAGDPDDGLQRFVGESSWARWEARRADLADPAPRAPDRASPSRLALFQEIKDALDRDPSGASARPLAAKWRALIEAEAEGNATTIASMRAIAAARGKWPEGARRYVASLYDADVETWERVMAAVEEG